LNSVKKIRVAQTYTIRKEILRKNIDLPYKFSGDLDDGTFHLGAFKADTIVGVVSFMKSDLNKLKGTQYQLRGMATSIEVRKEGFGNLLLKEAFEFLKQNQIDIVWCNAREEAVGFYQKNGFKILGDQFNIEKEGVHYKMYKKIK